MHMQWPRFSEGEFDFAVPSLQTSSTWFPPCSLTLVAPWRCHFVESWLNRLERFFNSLIVKWHSRIWFLGLHYYPLSAGQPRSSRLKLGGHITAVVLGQDPNLPRVSRFCMLSILMTQLASSVAKIIHTWYWWFLVWDLWIMLNNKSQMKGVMY